MQPSITLHVQHCQRCQTLRNFQVLDGWWTCTTCGLQLLEPTPSRYHTEPLTDFVTTLPPKPYTHYSSVDSALSGTRGDNQYRIAQTCLDLTDLLLRKNKDYGSSAWDSPVLVPSMPAKEALLVRMSDKVKRISTLTQAPNQTGEVPESLTDSIRDLAGYCLLWLSCPNPVPEKYTPEHLPTCGTRYRGCDPTCPKHISETFPNPAPTL
jgi:hypothetical protein